MADRAQVDQLAAWIDCDYDAERPPGERFYVNVNVFFRNASHLPIDIVQVGVDIRSKWEVPDMIEPVAGTKQSTHAFSELGRFTPDQPQLRYSHRLDVHDHQPAGSGKLWHPHGIVCEFISILVIDNAGRRWRLQPGRAGFGKAGFAQR